MKKVHPRAMSRGMHERMFRLVALLQKGGVIRLEDVAADLGVTRKTVMADVDHLRSLDHKIEFSRANGWRYLEPPPDLALSPDELFALLVAQKAMSAYQGTPLESPLHQVFSKFSGEDAKVFRCTWDFLSRAITVKPNFFSTTDSIVYRRVVTGISMKREIRFQYRGLRDCFARRRRIRPYHLCCWSNAWYLIGHDHERGDIRTFSLPRISAVEVMETTFPSVPDSLLQKAVADSFGIFFEAKTEHVEIWFSAHIARWVQERTWHNSQSFEFHNDGDGLLSMDVGLTPELEQWILSFGEQAAVLRPDKLRSKMEERHESAVEIYKSGAKAKQVA